MIEIRNFTRTFNEEALIKNIAKNVLKKEGMEGLNLSIAIVGEKRIKRINKRYRKKNKATDVLSFSYRFFEKEKELGEVVICPKQIKRDKKELQRTLIHGILHLLSYDHKNKKEEEAMRKREDYHLL